MASNDSKPGDRAKAHGGTTTKVPVWKPVVMQAKHQTPCSYCHLPISPGNAIYPWGNYTGYMHLTCALKEANEQNIELLPPVCKHWSRRGYCLYKDKCFYQHPPDALPPKQAPVDLSNHNAATNQAQRISNRGVGRRNLVRNAFRAGVFRRFLIDTFGRDVLNQGSGVLDIAGGKGELSFELVNLNGIQATVLEPRSLQLWRQHKWMLKGFYHRNVNFQSYVDHRHHEFVSGSRACVDPPHVRMVFDEAVVNSLATNAAAQTLTGKPPFATQLCTDQAVLASDSSKTSFEDANAELDSNWQTQNHQTSIADDAAAFAGDGSGDGTGDGAACQQRQDTNHMAAEAESRLNGGEPAIEPNNKDRAWRHILQQSMALARDTRWTHKGLQHEDGQAWAEAETGRAEPDEAAKQELLADLATCDIANNDDKADGPTDVVDLDVARSIIQNCSLIVGIHPDQAAEPIIDFAQKTRRPFAMVPCCVYPMEFPKRRLPDGTWVRKYEQLIQYLQSRDPEHIRVTTLPFEGRNQVVYCTAWT